MGMVKFLFPGGTRKTLTLSYDDGVEQDRRLVDILNRHGLKCTFNLNSGIQHEGSHWVNQGVTIRRMNQDGLAELYQGHEVAVHGLTHPFLNDLPRETRLHEILEDRRNLESWFGYPVTGMAYPFGTYNAPLLETLQACGIAYARTVEQHENFSLPEQPLTWHPTCHHNNPKLMALTERFLAPNHGNLTLFYVWGHSYEFDVDNNWSVIERFAETVGGKSDVWYATNGEIVAYMKAMQSLTLSVDGTMVYNPSGVSVWVDVDGLPREVKPGCMERL